MRDCTFYVAKMKALISCVVTAQMICTFLFAHAKSRFSHCPAHFQEDFMHTLCLSPLQAKIFGQSFMMSRLNVAVDDVANAEAEKKAQ